MKRQSMIALLAASAVLFVLSAAGAPSATRPVPKTLLAEGGSIHAFAQDAGAVAWIGPGYLVHVRRIGAKHGAVIGDALQKGGPVRIAARPLALAPAHAPSGRRTTAATGSRSKCMRAPLATAGT
jgi:hypothetical protein